MNKTLYKIEPFFEARLRGGDRLIRRYHYQTAIRPAGEVYSVVALPGQADCPVSGTGLTLSAFYRQQPEGFRCDTGRLPIRVNILDPGLRNNTLLGSAGALYLIAD